MASTMPAATKRACDACHRRKVRCNGSNPCQNCVQASLACTFNKPPMKKGPKGSRAKVISELRKTQADRPSGSGDSRADDSPSGSPTFSRPPELLTQELIEGAITSFFERIYPTLPILHRGWIRQRALEMNSSSESYCLIGSLCAFMVIQPGIGPSAPTPMSPASTVSTSSERNNTRFGMRLVDDVRRRRSVIDSGENPSTASILTSFLISATLFGLEKHTSAWYHLQEAILFARILRIHDDKSYQVPETAIDVMNRRLFFILFISERAQALQKHRDLTMHETISFPEPGDDSAEAAVIPGLLCLYNLFSIVDDKMSEIWNNLRQQSEIVWPPNTSIWLARLQKDLTEAFPSDLQVTEIQEVDLKSTQLWLRSIVWQLSTASGCLSSNPHDQTMSFSYPIQIARELVDLTSRASVSSMEAHGIGFVEKLFDIAFTLVDVMTVVPIETTTFEVGPRDHLTHILYMVSNLRNGESRFVGLLQAKIRDSLPNLAASLQLPVAPTPPANSQTDRNMYPENSTESARSSPYGSPDVSHPVLASTNSFPSMLAHTHSNQDSMNMDPISPNGEVPGASAIEPPHAYGLGFSQPGAPGHGPGTGGGSGYPS